MLLSSSFRSCWHDMRPSVRHILAIARLAWWRPPAVGNFTALRVRSFISKRERGRG